MIVDLLVDLVVLPVDLYLFRIGTDFLVGTGQLLGGGADIIEDAGSDAGQDSFAVGRAFFLGEGDDVAFIRMVFVALP